MSEKVTIFEMGPRDGLQNEKSLIDTKDKILLVDMLSDCGFQKIEVTSFVSPKWVPQMADSADVMAGINRKLNISYAVLTPNLHGLEGAVDAAANEVAIFASASEGFSQRNINCSIAESLERFSPVMAKALEIKLPVRGYVSCVTDCPYEGPTDPAKVAKVAKTLTDIGCYEISLGDTIGHATPESLSLMLDHVLDVVPVGQLAGHFHDTKGMALSNIETCLDRGIRVFDSSVGGLGGCPYAPGAKGNVATEQVANLMAQRGFETGLDESRLQQAVQFAKTLRSVA
ncbi:hydroxymethylglutaryl-CoA lyase [Ruegeria atlantica]|uniref:hydroxymethylglutaryl-CoA lyase n=1 Tax=Ruegeria atlantica TaxID=81569 RepID=UPI0024959F14|nr:hydroxymethylglutaryl-CoA lyase [Ruegeria atlantica]